MSRIFSTRSRHWLLLLGLGAVITAIYFLQARAREQTSAPVTVLNVSLDSVQSVFPLAAALRPLAGQADLGEVLDQGGQALGIVILTSPLADGIIGYLGPMPLLIGLNTEGRIAGIRLLPNAETGTFIRQIEQTGLLQAWDGLAWEKTRSLQVDTVGGATASSRAIIQSLRFRLSALSRESLTTRWQPTLPDILTLVFIVMALFFFWFRFKYSRAARTVLLVMAVIYLGFFRGLFLSTALFAGWLPYGWPWPSGWILLVLAALAVALPLLTGKPFYCNYLCPFGAAQELVSKISPWRLALGRRWYQGLAWSRRAFLGLIAVLMLLNVSVDLTQFEPFTAFLVRTAGVWVLSLAAASLLLSLWLPRFWCTALCPTGAFLDLWRRPRK